MTINGQVWCTHYFCAVRAWGNSKYRSQDFGVQLKNVKGSKKCRRTQQKTEINGVLHKTQITLTVWNRGTNNINTQGYKNKNLEK